MAGLFRQIASTGHFCLLKKYHSLSEAIDPGWASGASTDKILTVSQRPTPTQHGQTLSGPESS